MAYDGAGNLAWSAGSLALTSHNSCNEGSVPAAAKTVRTYDARNRLATLAFPDGQGSQALTYTPDGLQASITTENDAGELQRTTNSYSYNRRRFLTREILQFGSVFTWPVYYAYNVNGHLSSLSWHGLDVNYAPNALGQPTQAGTYATGVAYHPNGGVKEFSYGNGIKHSVTQNARGLPDTSCDFYGTCTSSAILNDGYDYDQVGNVAAISDGRTGGRGNRSMTYDSLDRLTQVVSPMFGTATYGYDTLDNLTRVKLTGGNQVRDHYYCYDGSWRLTNVKTGSCAGATVMGLGYDAQGNLANKNGRTYTFDYGNRLRSNSGSPGSSYAYDGHGRRVLDQVGTGPKYTHYLQDGRLSMTGDNRAGKVAEYVYLQGSLVAIRERDVVTNVYTTKYQHTDALGSPLAITDQSRAVLERTEYEPYGWTANRVGRDGPGYTGHVEDAATSLTYMQQRYYDPQIGLFLSVDPVTAYSNPVGQFHRYRYANNNPYKFTDPDGRIADIVLDIGFAAYSAYVLAKDPSWTNLAALGADIGAAAVPGVTGAGVAVRAGGSAADAVRAVNGVTDATRAARPADGAAMGTDEALDTASSYLGDGYKQIADGVFRSADGTRQVRMTNSDLATSKNHAGAPHMNFEEGVTTTKPSGRQVFDAEHNSHVYLSDENRR
ncbi:RHS repeat-associated core domain-containing protein [Luteimonas sp. RIT-PG2_3]